MNNGFVKLYGSILTSSIWGEPSETRIVWITMLTMADASGFVRASVPGLARIAGVTIPEAEAALAKLQEPDPYSGTPDYEGRRIMAVDGGWLLLNHGKYRDMQTPKQIADAERQRRKYERDKRETSRASRNLAPYTYTDPNTDPNTNTPSLSALKKDRSETVPYDEMIEQWNVVATEAGLPLCADATDARKAAMKTRWAKKKWREQYPKALAAIKDSDFLMGEGDRKWKVNFDWLLKPDSVTKIAEGMYANSGGGKPDKPINRHASKELQAQKDIEDLLK